MKKLLVMWAVLACFCAISAPAYATEGDAADAAVDQPGSEMSTEAIADPEESSSWLDQAKQTGSDLWSTVKENAPGWVETAKDKAGDVADTVREKAPGVLAGAKEAASDAVDKVKEEAPEAIENAQQAVTSNWNAQQDQFWQWFDWQTGLNTTGKVNPPASEEELAEGDVDSESDTTADQANAASSQTDDAASSGTGGDSAPDAANSANAADDEGQPAQGDASGSDGEIPPESEDASQTPDGQSSTSTQPIVQTDDGTLVATKELTNPGASTGNTEPSADGSGEPDYSYVDPTANVIAILLMAGGGLVLILIVLGFALASIRRYNRRGRRRP